MCVCDVCVCVFVYVQVELFLFECAGLCLLVGPCVCAGMNA